MALYPCPECDQQISDKALSCPNCGVPFQRKLDLSNMPWPERFLKISAILLRSLIVGIVVTLGLYWIGTRVFSL
jgi:hypothetical protein